MGKVSDVFTMYETERAVFVYWLQHMFSCRSRQEIFSKMTELSNAYLSLPITFLPKSITYEEFLYNRLGQYR